MGGKLSCSCCSLSTPPLRRKDRISDRRLNRTSEDPAVIVQHISERVEDNWYSDPSLHPQTGTIFLEKSKVENGLSRKKSLNHLVEIRPLKKSSSCSTIYLDDSTVSQPHLKNTLKCISLAIFYHIKNRTSEREMEIFNERIHPFSGEDAWVNDFDRPEPDHRQIYKFVRMLFNAAQLNAECAIITLIYIERLLTSADVDMTVACWRRMVLGAMLLASKVFDDQAVWNVDYCQILKDLSVHDMNELEKQYLHTLQFTIEVSSSVYAKYYFDLRALAEDNELVFPAEPLSVERAQKLEALSRSYENKLTADFIGIKKCSSLDNVNSTTASRRSVAILS